MTDPDPDERVETAVMINDIEHTVLLTPAGAEVFPLPTHEVEEDVINPEKRGSRDKSSADNVSATGKR